MDILPIYSFRRMTSGNLQRASLLNPMRLRGLSVHPSVEHLQLKESLLTEMGRAAAADKILLVFAKEMTDAELESLKEATNRMPSPPLSVFVIDDDLEALRAFDFGAIDAVHHRADGQRIRSLVNRMEQRQADRRAVVRDMIRVDAASLRAGEVMIELDRVVSIRVDQTQTLVATTAGEVRLNRVLSLPTGPFIKVSDCQVVAPTKVANAQCERRGQYGKAWRLSTTTGEFIDVTGPYQESVYQSLKTGELSKQEPIAA
ncbi:DNA-binding LytR/AlgR family response regulator [Roseateles asaccharophilus]|uniref:hypothetical protein n=1 Tax=Roseateles asaccharophilus TaxID=582607 RepID=UPI003836C128